MTARRGAQSNRAKTAANRGAALSTRALSAHTRDAVNTTLNRNANIFVKLHAAKADWLFPLLGHVVKACIC